MSILKITIAAAIAITLTACGGGGGNSSAPTSTSTGTTTTPTTTTSTPTSQVASILLSAPSPVSLLADGTSSVTLTVRALDASNALVKGAVIALNSSGASILSDSSVTTSATTGLATVTLTANTADQSTRIATVNASCATACTATAASLNAQINGATLTVSSGTTLTVGGGATTLNAVVRDASGVALANVPVTLTSTDPSVLVVGSTTATSNTSAATYQGTTNSTGTVSASVFGLSASSSASINVVALGNAKSQPITVGAATGSLAFSSPFNSSYNLPFSITVNVAAPSANLVNFASTLGTFSAPATTGVAGTPSFAASRTLQVTQAGTVTVTAADDLGRTISSTFKVSPAVADANKIILNANQTTLALASATSTPFVRITAQAVVNATGQAVSGVPIYFSMAGGPGAGEYLSTAYQVTDSAGNAFADFYSGTAASTTNGITVTARILNVATQNVSLTIGGSALSVAFGGASVIRESTDKTLYLQDYSVQVTDSNNNPVSNAPVTLRLTPVAFSLGSNCSIDFDPFFTTVGATYCSEDTDGDGSLDAGEDSVRILTTSASAGSCPSALTGTTARAGLSDALLTPQNSVAGSVPSTVTTNSNGVASFVHTYLKANSIWVVAKLTATISAYGTESKASTIFRLAPTVPDSDPDCFIPNSPFQY